MPPGRPRKYATEEEKRLADNASKRASYKRNNGAITKRRWFKKNQREGTGREEGIREEDASASTSRMNPAERRSDEVVSPSPLHLFIQKNPESPAHPIFQHLRQELDAAPEPSHPYAACAHLAPIAKLMRGRQWGEFAFTHLAIPDGELFRRRMDDFKRVLSVVDELEVLVGKILEAAFDMDPSGTRGPLLQAKWLSRDVKLASLHLQDVVSLRKDGLECLQEFARQRILEFQVVGETL